jgi:hypothetical protein
LMICIIPWKWFGITMNSSNSIFGNLFFNSFHHF